MSKKKEPENKLTRYDAATLERALGDRWVTMSNALTRAGHGLTLSEKRVVMMAVASLDSSKILKPGDEPRSRIVATDYAKECGVSIDTAYNQLQSTAKNLYGRSITFYKAAHKRNGEPLPPTKVQMRWVYKVEYHEGEGCVDLFWSPPILQHLTGLKQQFTSYQLKQTSALRSIYSWRLLELLMRFKKTGRADYTIEDFCMAIDAPEKHALNFAKIRTKIIEPAIKELREKDGWLIEWEAIKAGRKVKALRFTFQKNPQLSLFDALPESR